MTQNKNRLDILYTVQPDEPISEEAWLEHVKAGRLVQKYEPIDRARDLNGQYNYNGELNPLYKKIIQRWRM